MQDFNQLSADSLLIGILAVSVLTTENKVLHSAINGEKNLKIQIFIKFFSTSAMIISII